MEVKILYNYDENLFCCSCKQKIEIGEKFSIVYEQLYNGEVIEKCYHIDKDCLPENEEEPYISPEEE
jgi:hypothetical protein